MDPNGVPACRLRPAGTQPNRRVARRAQVRPRTCEAPGAEPAGCPHRRWDDPSRSGRGCTNTARRVRTPVRAARSEWSPAPAFRPAARRRRWSLRSTAARSSEELRRAGGQPNWPAFRCDGMAQKGPLFGTRCLRATALYRCLLANDAVNKTDPTGRDECEDLCLEYAEGVLNSCLAQQQPVSYCLDNFNEAYDECFNRSCAICATPNP
jgi:hypothetical protein